MNGRRRRVVFFQRVEGWSEVTCTGLSRGTWRALARSRWKELLPSASRGVKNASRCLSSDAVFNLLICVPP